MRILLIGYGSIGSRHCRILEESYPGCRIDVVSRQQLQGRRVFAELASVPELSLYDYFLICSETQLHHEQLLHLDRRVRGKKILVEKALFHRALPFVGGNNAIYVGYNMRYEPTLQRLKQELKGERILMAHAYVGQYLPHWHPWADYRKSYSALAAKGGGVLLDLSHELDYLQWLSGGLSEIAAFSGRVSTLEIETEDLVSGVARSSGGGVVNFTMDYLSKVVKRHLMLHTEERTFFCDFIKNELVLGDKGGAQSVLHFGEAPHDETYRAMHRAILEEGGGDACTLEEGIQTMALCERIRNSIALGGGDVSR